jgi:hypothetical protein
LGQTKVIWAGDFCITALTLTAKSIDFCAYPAVAQHIETKTMVYILFIIEKVIRCLINQI